VKTASARRQCGTAYAFGFVTPNRAYDAAMAEPGPRITPLTSDEWDDRVRRVLEASPGGTEEPMHIFATLARSPELFRRWMGFGGALLYGSLPSRLSELVILRTAYRFDGRYEWAQHVEMGQARGVTLAEIEALGGDRAALDAVAWEPLERAALRAVDETRDDGDAAAGEERAHHGPVRTSQAGGPPRTDAAAASARGSSSMRRERRTVVSIL